MIRKLINSQNRNHLIFGSNTDVGKTIMTAGLVNACIRRKKKISMQNNHNKMRKVQYIKPLQCGGSDQSFVDSFVSKQSQKEFLEVQYVSHILHRWESFASPHLASIVEEHFVSNDEVLNSLIETLNGKHENMLNMLESNRYQTSSYGKEAITTFIETAGGVLSPGPSSLSSKSSSATTSNKSNVENSYIWSTQADLYSPLKSNFSTILVGDGTLGGISATLSSLESLWLRGYQVDVILLLEKNIHLDADVQNDEVENNIITSENLTALSNAEAIQHYLIEASKSNDIENISMPSHSHKQIIQHLEMKQNIDVVCFTKPLPPMPEPLDDWFNDPLVMQKFDDIETILEDKWSER